MSDLPRICGVILLTAAIGCTRQPASPVSPMSAAGSGQVRLADANTVPTYPSVLLSAGVEGEVTLALAVRSNGRVDSARTTVMRSTHELFSNAVFAVLPSWRVSDGGPRRNHTGVVTIAFDYPRTLGVSQFARSPERTQNGGPVYVIGERAPRGPSSVLTGGPLADSLLAAVRAAGDGPQLGKVKYYAADQVAFVDWAGEFKWSTPRPACASGYICGGSFTRESGVCALSRRAGGWTVRCRSQLTRGNA